VYNQDCRLNIKTYEMREFCVINGNLIRKFHRNERENESRWERKYRNGNCCTGLGRNWGKTISAYL